MSVKCLFAVCIITTAMPTLVHAEQIKTTLSGEWVTACLPIGKSDRHGQITRIKINDDKLAASSQIYETNTCKTPTVQVNYFGRMTTTKINGTYIDFQHTVGKITFTLGTDKVSAYYNQKPQEAGCGLTGWKTNDSRSVAGKTCALFSFAAEGTILFDRAWIKENQLRFGNFPTIWTATNAVQRPTIPQGAVFYQTAS